MAGGKEPPLREIFRNYGIFCTSVHELVEKILYELGGINVSLFLFNNQKMILFYFS